MFIKQVEVGGMLNFAYIIGDPETKEGIVIDPSWEPERVYDIDYFPIIERVVGGPDIKWANHSLTLL